MKTLLRCCFLMVALSCQNSYAQFTLEHTYPHAGDLVGNSNELMMVNFEVDGYRYVNIDRDDSLILLYDLNHSLVKTITVPDGLLNSNDGTDLVLYLSQHLFNTDNKIEYMLCVADMYGLNFWSTYVFDEDGNELFYKSDEYPSIILTWHAQQFPIYNTPEGTKLILSSTINDSAYVYSLPGTLSTFIEDQNNSLLKSEGSNLFPNPTSDITHIEYHVEQSNLPAYLKIFDLSGNEKYSAEIKTEHGFVDFSALGLTSGTYTYFFEGKQQKISGNKFIVVH